MADIPCSTKSEKKLSSCALRVLPLRRGLVAKKAKMR